MATVWDKISNFDQIVRSMQWWDYADILVVALLIYKLLSLIRTPHMMRLARAAGALVLIALLTGSLRMHTVNWLISEFMKVGVTVFVVLFQPELRRMLDHLATMRLTNFFTIARKEPELLPVITQTVLACENMSREKVGALVVFEREHKLDEYFKTGTLIDAQVSEQLLRNIFFPKAALHDGAMIIREGRVAAAGCVLPLSSSPWLSADLGTRHRAGVGISEVSDAVVIVVSEETGTISVATGGMLKRHLTPQTLEKLLRNELCPQNEDNGLSLSDLLNRLTGSAKEGNHG